MTDKEIFDTVSNHLLDQGTRATNDDGDCQYRTRSGRTCALGCLISDQAYDATIEGATISSSGVLIVEYRDQEKVLERVLIASDIEKSQYTLLGKLQNIHDNKLPSDWVDELEMLKQETFGQ